MSLISSASFEDGYLHFYSDMRLDKIPETLHWSKHSERHFIFYNCELLEITPNNFLDKRFEKRINYKYKISYEKKFTSKYKDEVDSMFLTYIRNKKINDIL